MATVNLYEAKTQLSDLVKKASEGEETVICKAGVPMAKLVPVHPAPAPEKNHRVFGRNELGITYIAPDFDDPVWTDEELEEMGLA